MEIYKDEIFGPVLVVLRADTLEEAIALVNRNPYANGTAIFTESGGAARRFENEIQVGMVGINVPIPVPVAFYSFGGWKSSLFGDLHVHGTEGVKFYTRTKVDHHALAAPGHAGAGLQHADAGLSMKRVLVAAVAALCMAGAQAQEYPIKTIRLIVPLTPGAGADIAARIVAQRMSEHWKQPVIVENRPGAGGQIGTSAVVKAEPDGHTLLVQSSSHAANPAIYQQPALRPAEGPDRRRDPRQDAVRHGERRQRSLSIAEGAARRGEGEAGRDRLLLRRRSAPRPTSPPSI